MSLAVVISLIGVIQVLIAVAVVVFLILGLKWLLAKVAPSMTLPEPMWAVLGFILILLVLLFALGVFGGGGVSFR